MQRKKRIIVNDKASSCFFRTTTIPPHRKALIQITERCNLHCAHCFVSARKVGNDMNLSDIKEVLLPRLIECNVISVTLTGGEPFIHPKILSIVKRFVESGIKVTLCTNATLITEKQLQSLQKIGGVKINASLDGFKPESHGKFRGDISSFQKTKQNIRLAGNYNLLKGILVTPNIYAKTNEYSEICNFAIECGASYVLFNPLSEFGRGVNSSPLLASSNDTMREIRKTTDVFKDTIDVVYIRFPNSDLPLSGCEAGKIIYVFTSGDLTICPYLSFAAESPSSKYSPNDFLIGNIFKDEKVPDKLKNLQCQNLLEEGNNSVCNSCELKNNCFRGCPASIISTGQLITGLDREVCPKYNI